MGVTHLDRGVPSAFHRQGSPSILFLLLLCSAPSLAAELWHGFQVQVLSILVLDVLRQLPPRLFCLWLRDDTADFQARHVGCVGTTTSWGCSQKLAVLPTFVRPGICRKV